MYTPTVRTFPAAEAVVGAVQRDPEGLPDTDRACTRLASPNGLTKLLVRGAGCGKAARPDM
jgi:hypothetical protein